MAWNDGEAGRYYSAERVCWYEKFGIAPSSTPVQHAELHCSTDYGSITRPKYYSPHAIRCESSLSWSSVESVSSLVALERRRKVRPLKPVNRQPGIADGPEWTGFFSSNLPRLLGCAGNYQLVSTTNKREQNKLANCFRTESTVLFDVKLKDVCGSSSDLCNAKNSV